MKFLKGLLLALAAINSIGFFALTVYSNYLSFSHSNGSDFENYFYIALAVFAVLLYWLLLRSASLRKKLVAAGATSVSYVLLVFLANNFFRYLSFNAMFQWVDPVSYWDFAKSDIVYTQGWGEFRYPIVFSAMFALCVIAMLLQSQKVADFFDGLSLRILKKAGIELVNSEDDRLDLILNELCTLREEVIDNFEKTKGIRSDILTDDDIKRALSPDGENEEDDQLTLILFEIHRLRREVRTLAEKNTADQNQN